MGLRITPNGSIQSHLAKARQEGENALEKLSSGVRFTRMEPMPAERAVSDSLSARMRELNSYRKNANDGVSVVEMADAGLSQITNITVRLKELAAQASSPTLSDKERQFLFVEYQALFDEINRVAKTTTFNGSPLLAGGGVGGSSSTAFRVGPPGKSDDSGDVNLIKLDQLEEVKATSEDLGLKSVRHLLSREDGVSLDDVADVFDSSVDSVGSNFDKAFEKLASIRAAFGAVGSRLNRVLDVIDVAYENISAANSRLKDVDYASEVANLTKANILVQAGVSLLTQGNIPAQAALQLVRGFDK